MKYSGPVAGESQLRQSRATQCTVHAGCFIVSIIHRTVTWTTGSLTCTQMLIHATAHGGVRTHVREFALKIVSGRKKERKNNLCRTGESNLRQRRAGPTAYHLSYKPILVYCGYLTSSQRRRSYQDATQFIKPQASVHCNVHDGSPYSGRRIGSKLN